MSRCKNVFIAAIVGGLLFLLWGAVAHRGLGLVDRTMKGLPNETAVLAELSANTPLPGMYFFPYADLSTGDEAVLADLEKRYATGPAGLIIYRPIGGEMMPPSMLIKEFLGGFAACAIVAFILGSLPIGMRGGAVMCGLFALAMTCSGGWSSHVWYGFPLDWVSDGAIEAVVGWILAGAAIGKIAGGKAMDAC